MTRPAEHVEPLRGHRRYNAITALRGVFPSGNLERRNVQLAAKFVF